MMHLLPHRVGEVPVHRQLGHRFGEDHVRAGFHAGAGAVDGRLQALHRAVDYRASRAVLDRDRAESPQWDELSGNLRELFAQERAEVSAEQLATVDALCGLPICTR